MQDPAEQAFTGNRGCAGNRRVSVLPLQHMSQPAAYESVVQRWHVKYLFLDHGHKVHEQGRAYAHSGCVNKDFDHGHLKYPLLDVSCDCSNQQVCKFKST